MSDLPVSDLPVSELEYHLSSVRDGKSLLESMYVLSLAIYNLTACSHTVWGDQKRGNQHCPGLDRGDQTRRSDTGIRHREIRHGEDRLVSDSPCLISPCLVSPCLIPVSDLPVSGLSVLTRV